MKMRGLLSIIELSEDIDEAAWKSYSAFARCHASAFEIFNHEPIKQNHKFRRHADRPYAQSSATGSEAYWCFFKVLTFGSAGPKDRPKQESMAMEIRRCKLHLSDHLNGQHGRMVRASLKELNKRRISSSTSWWVLTLNSRIPPFGPFWMPLHLGGSEHLTSIHMF
jgi:hypothetical protein